MTRQVFDIGKQEFEEILKVYEFESGESDFEIRSVKTLDFVAELSSHSFRRGLSTSAARERVDFELIKKQGGWKSDATVWEYIEEGQQLSDNATVILMKKMASMLSIGNDLV